MLSEKKLKVINKGLFGILVALAMYIMLLPVLPAIQWWVQHSVPVVSSPTVRVVSLPKMPKAATNSLYIPSLDLTQPILEGASVATVERGIWRRPLTSSPDKGGNTVLVGHRFTYSGNGVFYHLDKVRIGDQIVVQWQNKIYEYKVENIREVSATEISVEDPSNQSILTLYTCTPLLSAKNRLVIQANLVRTL